MTIDEAKKEITSLKNYVAMLEGYTPTGYEQEAIKMYVELESVTKVAIELNAKGYKVNDRKVISKDVSDLIRSESTDELHELAKKMFQRNKKKSTGRNWL